MCGFIKFSKIQKYSYISASFAETKTPYPKWTRRLEEYISSDIQCQVEISVKIAFKILRLLKIKKKDLYDPSFDSWFVKIPLQLKHSHHEIFHSVRQSIFQHFSLWILCLIQTQDIVSCDTGWQYRTYI